jgi:predicted secreted protein
MSKSFNIFAAVTVTALALSSAIDPAKAAVINWGSPVTISGTTDIDTVGTLFQASNFAGSATTVNGVLFDAFNVADGNGTVGNIGITGGQNITTFGEGGPATAYGSLPSEYQELLKTGIIFGATVTIQNLTIGVDYLIQFMANDSRLATASQDRTVSLNTNQVTLDINSTNAEGGVGQWVRGTFTADATTQSFTVDGSSHAYSNAMQVRTIAVPEPTQMVSVAAIGSALGMWRMRKLRRDGCDSDATAC